MSLSKKAKRIYQREYMRRKRSNIPVSPASVGLTIVLGKIKHVRPVPYPTNPTLKQSREWEEYRAKLRKQ